MNGASLFRRVVAVTAGCALSAGFALSAQPFVPREGPVPQNSPFVPVRLDDYAANNQGALPATRQVTVEGIPFDLVSRQGADNLFLDAAGWPDWKADPSDYYSAYDSVPAVKSSRRPFFKIPVADYDCVYLLAATDNAPEYSPAITFRIGVFESSVRTTIHDFAGVVPRASESKGDNVLQVIPTKAGNLFLMRIPLGLALAQDFKDRTTLDVEVTKEVRLAIRQPDPCRFQYRPLGLPSGVHLYGMTFCRAPIQMDVDTVEPGHVFNEPQTPTFQVRLHAVDLPGLGSKPCVIEAVATHYDGETTTVTSNAVPAAQIASGARIALPVKVGKRGYYQLSVNVKQRGKTLLTRQTSFALLAPDTRKHRDEAPWGTWDFEGTHFTPDNPDLLGPLEVKAGLRYGFAYGAGHDRESCRKYGMLPDFDLCGSNAQEVESIVKRCADGELPTPERFMIFHEHCISGPHVTRTPDMFTGRPAYKFDAAEQKQFQTYWDGALAACKIVREKFPKAVIYFGNGAPQILEEFLRRKFPRELFDVRGNEASGFQLPETQPLDFGNNNSGIWMDRQVLDHYGYKDVPVYQCYEITIPATSPGNLTLHTQADYLVRDILHSMAWEVPVIRTAEITDVGSSYYFSHWGAGGFCTAKPDVAPKPAYVAVATMTQALDGAKFSRVVPCAAPTVYALEFRRPDEGYVTCLWTVRGKRKLTLEVPEETDEGHVTDMMGNETSLRFRHLKATVELSSDPQYVATPDPLASLTAGESIQEERPAGKHFVVSPLNHLEDWSVEPGTSLELEMYNPLCPRRKGNFSYREVAKFEGERHVIEVEPQLPVEGSEYLPMYSVLSHKEGLEIPGEPTEIGLMVNGNGGWGRVIFELEDASGQRWVSLGCESNGRPTAWMADWMSAEQFKALKTSNQSDWGTDDCWGRCAINFEGWRYLHFPLPGNYPGENFHWPYNSQWRFSGDGIVKYPLKFKKLIITIPEKVLHFRNYAPVPRQEIFLKDLMVTYEPPGKAFHAE